MDFPSSSTLQSVKERMREKLNGTLKAVKLQTSLAAKIKTKTLNNSSILKVSLKYNNKALACALTAEKEKSRRLGNDKMFLQKEVKMLHFKNALLRQNLKTVNEMLKEIEMCMKNNLSAAIKISNPMEYSDRLSAIERMSDRFSQQSALCPDEDQGFSIRLLGQALRVPSNGVWQQQPNSQQLILANEEVTPLIVPPSSVTNVLNENCDKPEERKTNRLSLSSKEHLSVCSERRSWESFSKVKACDDILQLDEVFSPTNRNAQSGGFVTRRRKRSTGSHSNTASKSSAANRTRSSTGVRRESSCTQWEMTTELGNTAEKSYIDSVLQKDRQSTTLHCPKRSQNLDTSLSSDVGRNINISCKESIPSTSQLQLNEGSYQPIDECVAQERTVYETDMEMTSSESSSIIAVLPKNKRQTSKKKSGIPVKETGTLRKVKRMGREKAKRTESSIDQQINDLPNSNDKGDPAEKSMEKLISDRHYDRRTYILPGSVVQERLDGLASEAQSNEVSALRESCGTGRMFPNNTIELNGVKNKLAFNLQKDHCTETSHVSGTAPKRRSKTVWEMPHIESSREKKHKRHKNSINQGQVTEEKGDLNDSSEQMNGSTKNPTMLNIHTKDKQPNIRRETYVLAVTNPVPNSLIISKLDEINYRRETFVIPEPDPLVSINLGTSVFEVRNDTLKEPQNDINPLVSTDDSHEIENRLDVEKEHCDAILNPDYAYAYKKHVSRRSEKKASSNLFSQLNKRKTQILSIKQSDVQDERVTLVRESFMNPILNQRDKTLKFPDFMGSTNESFLLDMVSESVLDNTMESSSFSEFPSKENPEDAGQLTIDIPLKSVPAVELSVTADCNVLDENDGNDQQNTLDTAIGSNWQCKIEDQSMEIHESAIKPLQDLTNKSLGSSKPSPKLDSQEGSSRCPRRRRNPVSYKEPSLGKKLRRGDSHTNSEFLYSPAAKEKTKQKPKKNKVKSKKCKTEDV